MMHPHITQLRLPSEPASEPTAQQIQRALQRVLQSIAFRKATRLRGLLQYVIKTALNEQSYDEQTMLELLGKDKEFKPSRDATIRVQFGRLRTALSNYYLSEGSFDDTRIEIPARQYAPVFRRVSNGYEDKIMPQ
jgi:hypothetical protein